MSVSPSLGMPLKSSRTQICKRLPPDPRTLRISAGHAAKRARIDSGREASTSQAAGGAANLERELERSLREFVRLRTVSSDPTLREECFRGAKYLANLLESLGA